MTIKAHLHILFIAHVRVLNSQFLPIQKTNQQNGHISPHTLTKAQRMAHFGVPLLIILFVCAYGTFYLPFEGAPDKDFDLLHFWSYQNSLVNNPYLVTHQMVPPSFWRRFDVASLFTVVASCLILLHAATREDLDPEFRIQQTTADSRYQYSIGSLPLEEIVSAQIRAFQQRIPLLIWGSILPFFVIALSFYCVSILQNGLYQVTFFSVFYWTLLFPAWIFYLFYAVLREFFIAAVVVAY